MSEIFIKSDKTLNELALFLREKINISDKEKKPFGGFQKRYGDNYGGDYYLIEFFGLEIHLVENARDVFIEEMQSYNFYLMINTEYKFKVDKEIFDNLILYFFALLKFIGLEVELETK